MRSTSTSLTSLAGLVAIALAGAASAKAETHVGGVIREDTTWNLAGSPYIVTPDVGGSIFVGYDATLTIEPGVEVRFEPGLALLVGWVWGPGTLVARGTEQSPIRFTSNEAVPTPGDWGRIDFRDLAADANFDVNGNYQGGCILEHVIVECAGSGDTAAVNAHQSGPYLSYCEVRDNLWRGIAVYSTPPLRIENCCVHDNQDGGIYFYSSGSSTLAANTISGNSADSSGAGILFVWSDSNTLTGNTISGNSGHGANIRGGGIAFYFSDSNTLSGNTISGNSASGDSFPAGGGIFFTDSDSNRLSGNTISSNSAGWGGGGIHFQDSDSNALSGNTISGNSAGWGAGGICFFYSGSNTLTGNTISGNTADTKGGAMYFYDSDNNTLGSNTIRFNHTTGGQTGGVYVTYGSEWLSLNAGPEAYNTICCNDGYDIYNNNDFYGGDARHDIDAANVFWGTNGTGVIQAEIYDFLDDASRAMVVWYPFIWDPPAGDLNGDGCVDQADLGILLADWNCTGGDCPGDCDGDGDTDHADLGVLLSDWGSECSCQCD